MPEMQSTVADALRALREAGEQARHIEINLDQEFLRRLALVESLPANRDGVDKSWVWNADRAFRRHYEHSHLK